MLVPVREIGRRTGLRWLRRELCRFESSPGHKHLSNEVVGTIYIVTVESLLQKVDRKKPVLAPPEDFYCSLFLEIMG